MKKSIITTLLLFITALSYGQGKFTIKGKLKNVKDSLVLSIYRQEGTGSGTLAQRDTLLNGSFCFNITTLSNNIKIQNLLRKT